MKIYNNDATVVFDGAQPVSDSSARLRVLSDRQKPSNHVVTRRTDHRKRGWFADAQSPVATQMRARKTMTSPECAVMQRCERDKLLPRMPE